MRQELSAALSPFRTRVESCNHEALAWLVRQAEEAQTTPARPVPGNVPDLEHLDRYTYDVLGARVRKGVQEVYIPVPASSPRFQSQTCLPPV